MAEQVIDASVAVICGSLRSPKCLRHFANTRNVLKRIQVAILSGDYDLTRNAINEMAEDELSIFDVECAILSGEITNAAADTTTQLCCIGSRRLPRERSHRNVWNWCLSPLHEARKKHPDKVFYFVRVGFPAVYVHR